MEEKIPELTLNPVITTQHTEEHLPAEPAPEAGPEFSALSEQEQQAVKDFAEKIDITDSQLVLQYGAAAQKGIAEFSETALGSAKTRDLGAVGDMIGSLMTELKGFDAAEQSKGILGLFRKTGASITALRAKYEKANTNVEKIADQLKEHQLSLMKDVEILDQMYDKNLEYHKTLTMYILAGRERLERERTQTLPTLRSTAELSGLPEDAQKVRDFEEQCLRFEKKLHDLELTRVICLQMAPQIRLLQNNDTVLSEKIQTSLLNTIPLWKSQMVLALGVNHAQSAMEAQREVTNMTNDLLRKNAETLKVATVETAKETERGIVDLETLKNTNQSLISTFDEVLRIQTEGSEKRRAAETELRRIEGELKQKLMEIQG